MGFEVIVRPVVFPNIRPAPPRVLPPQNDPSQGLVTLTAGGKETASASYSFNISVSRQNPQQETKKQVDVERVYQVKNGTINKDNYVDVEKTKKSRFDKLAPAGAANLLQNVDPPSQFIYLNQPKPENVETIEADKTINFEPNS